MFAIYATHAAPDDPLSALKSWRPAGAERARWLGALERPMSALARFPRETDAQLAPGFGLIALEVPPQPGVPAPDATERKFNSRFVAPTLSKYFLHS